MTAEEIVAQALSTWPQLTASIGTRIYPDIAPQDVELPYIVYTRSGSEPAYTIHGPKAAELANMSVQIWNKSRFSVDQIGLEVVKAMNAHECFHTNHFGGYEADTELYAAQFDFSVWED